MSDIRTGSVNIEDQLVDLSDLDAEYADDVKQDAQQDMPQGQDELPQF
jgi:hypothetical protein